MRHYRERQRHPEGGGCPVLGLKPCVACRFSPAVEAACVEFQLEVSREDVAFYEMQNGHVLEVRPAAALDKRGFVHGPCEVTTFRATDSDGVPLAEGGEDVGEGEVRRLETLAQQERGVEKLRPPVVAILDGART